MRNFVASLVMRFVDRISNPARASARAIGDITKAQRMAKAAGEQWSRGLADLDDKLDRLAKVSLVTEGLDRAGRAMLRPLQTATRNAADFERGMTGIGITAQMTDRQLLPLRATIMSTAADLGALPATVQATFGAVLAEGVYRTEQDLSRAGAAVARFQKLAEVMRDPISDAEAGALSAAMGSSYRMASDQLDRANAMINRAAQLGGVGIGTVARALPEQSGSLVGLNFANTRGMADLLAANQIAKRLAGSSEQATNNITNLMGKLASPDVLKNFSEIGINLEREIKRGVAAGRSPLETLAEITARASKADQFRIGELVGDKEAKAGLMALVQNLDDFKAMSRDLQGDDVLAAYLADLDRAATGPASAFDRYTANISRAGIATGSILAPAVGVAADALSRVANWMSRAAESSNPLALAAVWIVAGFAGFAVTAGVVGHAVMGILAPMFIMKSLFGDMGGAVIRRFAAGVIGGLARARLAALAFNITMLANPVVLAVAAAIAAVALVAVVVRKYWQPISAFFVGFGRGLAQGFAPIGAALAPLRPLWDAIAGGLGRAWSWVTRLLTPVKSTGAELAGATNAGVRFGRAVATAIMGITMPFRAVIAVGRAVWPLLRTLFAFSPAGMVLANWRPIVGIVRGVVGGVINGARFGWAVIRALMGWSPLGTLRTAWSAVSGFFGGLVARFTGFGRNVIQGMINGILSMLGSVGSAVGQIGSSAVTAIRNRLGIRSPSRVFAALGGDTIEGFTQGLDRARRGPVASVAAMAAALLAAATTGVSLPLPAFAKPSAPVVSVVGSTPPSAPPFDPDITRRPPPPPAGAGAWRPSDIGPSSGFRFDAPTAPGASPAGTGSNITFEKVEQHFHLPAGVTDARSIARELARMGAQGLRGALNDAGLP